MTHKDLRGRVPLTKHVGGEDDVLDVRREVGVGELALAGSEPGEVEPQHADPSVYEASRDPGRGGDLLRTRKAVREQGVRDRVSLRTVEPAAQSITARSGEPNLLDPSNSLHTFEDEGDALARADTDADDAVARLAFPEFRGKGQDVAGTGVPKRMAERDSTAVGIEPVVGDRPARLRRELAEHREDLRGEGPRGAREFETQTGWTIPDDRLNPNGGALALGHPVGDSGTRDVVDGCRRDSGNATHATALSASVSAQARASPSSSKVCNPFADRAGVVRRIGR